jgi:thiol-disulfide isomerase/thioredoxin
VNRRQVLALGAAGGLAALAGAGWGWWRSRTGPDPGDDFWSQRFERPEGGQLELASFRGQVVVLNFWATWCPPCIKEMPDLDRLHRARNASGVVVVGLAVDSPTPVRQFLARQPVSFPIGLAGLGGTELSRRLGNANGALPFTVVFDRQGRPRQRKLGQTEYAELNRWVDGL